MSQKMQDILLSKETLRDMLVCTKIGIRVQISVTQQNWWGTT